MRGESLSIADTGVGIPRKQLGAVFEPFVRAGNASQQGHGVGLSIVKRLCDRFGWSVSIESAPKTGTCVRVRFPGAHTSDSVPHTSGASGAADDETQGITPGAK